MLHLLKKIKIFKHIYKTMVLILVVNSVIGAHLWSDLGYLICLRYWVKSGAVAYLISFLQKRPIFLHTWATCSKIPSIISTMVYQIPAYIFF